MFQFQIGAIKRRDRGYDLHRGMFQFQIGAIKSEREKLTYQVRNCFNSKLVRLKGFPKTTLILYYTLTVPVKLIFIFIKLESSLLSTSNRANSLGG